MKKIVACYNPALGSTLKEELESLEEYFEVKLFSEEECYSNSTIFLIVGGDGTLNYFINKVRKFNDFKIVYVPRGTANDFSKTLKIEDFKINSAKIKEIIESDFFVKVPLLKCNDKYFLNCVTGGAPAQVTESGDTLIKKLLGRFSYYLSALDKMFGNTIWKLSYTVRDKVNKFDSLGFVVSQGIFAGGGIKVRSASSPSFGDDFVFVANADGKLSSSLHSILEIQKENTTLNNAYEINTDNLVLESDINIPCKVDGESFESNKITFIKTADDLLFYLF